MIKRPALVSDRRFYDFVKRYAFNLDAFATHVCGHDVLLKQAIAFTRIERLGTRSELHESVPPDRDVKQLAQAPDTVAIVALWQLLTFHESNTYIAVTSRRKWAELLAPALRRMLENIANGPHGWIADHVVVTQDTLYVRDRRATWFITHRIARAAQPEALAGTWGRYLLWIIHDAHEVSDVCHAVIRGALTLECGRLLETVTKVQTPPQNGE
ncbi:hypothetical protein [Pseudomonas sp. NPDC090208]|uniref:hypothetical protein n=1 Tax=Pseudomonas sp. NPDC090208 TaxID=3364478 RepID=UPI003819BB95